jgi:HSP20 family protein
MALIRFSPGLDAVDALLALQRELGRASENPFAFDLGPSGRGVYPPLNAFTDGDGYVLRMEVPGIPPENLHIEAQGRTLTVSGKRDLKAPEGGSFHRRELRSGEFARSLQLPADLDLAAVRASCKHGILTVRIPKKEEAKPRQITIQAT